jgi:hypothetical protein
MNIIQIEKEIVDRIANCKSAAELREIQAWAKKAKKQVVIEPTVTKIRKMYYTYERRRRTEGGASYPVSHTVRFTAFTFMGLDIRLPDGKYPIDESLFDFKNVWVDRKITWGGRDYFPKEPITELWGINFLQYFIGYIKANNFFILVIGKTAWLMNSIDNAKKKLRGRRLTQFDLCNSPVVKLPTEHFLGHYLEIKTSKDFFTEAEPHTDYYPF